MVGQPWRPAAGTAIADGALKRGAGRATPVAAAPLWSADLQVRIMIMSGPGGPRSE